MNLKLIVAILVIAAVPVFAHAQPPSTAKVTKADAQKVIKIIRGDKAKTRIYCDMAKIGAQILQANEQDPKQSDELSQKLLELGKKLGPEYAALMDGLQGMDPESEEGQEIEATLDALDKLCGGVATARTRNTR